MEKKELQLMFKQRGLNCIIRFNSIIQLKDGKLLFMHNEFDNNIYIYNEKTFQKFFDINLYQFIEAFEKEQKKLKTDNKDTFNCEENYNKTIKELRSGFILIGLFKYLIELKLDENTYDCRIIKELDDTILNINELLDKRIIIITNEKIMIFKRENQDYIMKEQYQINENWKMIKSGEGFKQ